MSNLSSFFVENTERAEGIKYVASRRFKDEHGKPIEWELHSISGAEDEALRKTCMRRVRVPGRRNLFQTETDYDEYLGKLAVACISYPNLHDKELQDNRGVMGAEELLKKMLLPGEYADLLAKVQEVCDFESLEEEVDAVKNS